MTREISPQLRAEVEKTMNEIKRLAGDGVSRPVLQSMTKVIEGLAKNTSLFSRSDFPPPEGRTNVLYQIASDPDGRFTLYVSSANQGKETPPHNHTTWAVIVGIKGEELNKLYRRTDDGRTNDKAHLELTGEHVVKEGHPICLMPDEIHSIHVESAEPTLHLHLYGRRLADLKDRLQFDMSADKATYFPPNPNIR
jgi:predicted metal-dependent enzyme (double-stranded beta helix superfamily)